MGELGLGGVLADDMGLGKTLQTIALLADRARPDGPGATLRALGPMPAPAGAAPADLAPVVADAAAVAWRLVAGDPDHADDQEPVLAALRLGGSATSGELAGHLRCSLEQVAPGCGRWLPTRSCDAPATGPARATTRSWCA